ncbi:MAG: methylated-DNA--[protein]-cysteine S-methyltransferase [Porphyromonadaceae bacterium]|nr:methylated-DNA--[protein]-cysteine S-methyltransferase [Porphyromonadaceae bacterium]
MSKIIYTRLYHTPCGDLRLGAFEGKLCLCDWVNGKHRDSVERRLQTALQADYKEASSAVLQKAARQLDEYFAGKRKGFDIPLLTIGTGFQKSVWQALRDIPYGETISYGELAGRVGRPKAIRAAANATSANAISIFIPCHRVMGSDRSLTGYEGGLSAKKCLLEREQAI